VDPVESMSRGSGREHVVPHRSGPSPGACSSGVAERHNAPRVGMGQCVGRQDDRGLPDLRCGSSVRRGPFPHVL